jgi:hypothetical protein
MQRIRMLRRDRKNAPVGVFRLGKLAAPMVAERDGKQRLHRGGICGCRRWWDDPAAVGPLRGSAIFPVHGGVIAGRPSAPRTGTC